MDYRAQAKYGDELEVRTRLAGVGRSSFQYDYEIRNINADAPILIAKTVQVHFDYEAQRPVEMTDDFKARLQTPVEQIWQS